MRLVPIQQEHIKKLTKGVELLDFKIVGDKIHYTFSEGTVLKSKSFTGDQLSWIRMQSGTEKDFLKLVYDILLEMIKK